jgi:hypothetical protein
VSSSPGEDERGCGDLRQAAGRVVREAGVDLCPEGLHGLRVGEGQRLLDDLVHGPVRVRARRVDPGEERLEEGALARCRLRQPAPELELRAEEGVRASVGAHEHQAADQPRVAKRQLLRDGASHREAGDVGAWHVERAQDAAGVVGHRLDRAPRIGHRRAPRPAVVERGQAVAVGERVELKLPRLDGVAEAADEQHVGSVPDLLDVDVQTAGLDPAWEAV